MTCTIWNSLGVDCDAFGAFGTILYYLENSDGVDGALPLGASHRRPLKVTPLTLTAATAALQPAHYS